MPLPSQMHRLPLAPRWCRPGGNGPRANAVHRTRGNTAVRVLGDNRGGTLTDHPLRFHLRTFNRLLRIVAARAGRRQPGVRGPRPRRCSAQPRRSRWKTLPGVCSSCSSRASSASWGGRGGGNVSTMLHPARRNLSTVPTRLPPSPRPPPHRGSPIDSARPLPSDEFCYQKHVKQIHRNDDGTTQEVLLGLWDPEYHRLKVGKQKAGGGQRSTTSVTLYYKDVRTTSCCVAASAMELSTFCVHIAAQGLQFLQSSLAAPRRGPLFRSSRPAPPPISAASARPTRCVFTTGSEHARGWLSWPPRTGGFL